MEVMVETANSSNKLRHIDQSLPIMFLVIIIFICRLYLWREQCVLATLTEDWRYCSASWCGMPSDVSSIATSFALLPLSRRAIGTMGKQKTLAKSSWIDQRLHSTNQASTSTDSLGQRTRCPSQPPIFCHRGCAPTGIASGCLRFSEDWWKVLINLDKCVSTTLPRARSYWTFWLCAGRRARPRRQPPKLSGGLGLHAGAHGAFLLAYSARILRMSYRLMYTTQRKLHRRLHSRAWTTCRSCNSGDTVAHCIIRYSSNHMQLCDDGIRIISLLGWYGRITEIKSIQVLADAEKLWSKYIWWKLLKKLC